MKNDKKALILLSAVLLLGLASCGNEAADTSTEATAAADTSAAAEENGYIYPEMDLNGETFTFLNYETFASCNCHIDFDAETGDILNDAIFRRNRKVEERLNAVIAEEKIPYPGWGELSKIGEMVTTSVMAGDMAYDVAYMHLATSPGIITEGVLYDLNDMPGLHLDAEWWDRSINDSLRFNEKLYAASSPLNLISFDMSLGLLFNHEILQNRDIELPYQLVRDGEWTLDKMMEYVKAVVSLNGDDSFIYREAGNALYGVGRHRDIIQGFIYSADNHMATLNGTEFSFDFENERLVTTLEKVAALYNPKDGSGVASSGEPNYIQVFRNERALFVTCELKATLTERDMEATFGLLPLPKFDTAQESYYTAMNQYSSFLTVPSNVDNAAEIGVVLDALSYESYTNIVPVYYDVAVSQKGLRNEDSIDMLNIIQNTRGVEFSQVFGVTTALQARLQEMINDGDASKVVSTIASQKDAVVEKANALIDALMSE